VVAPLRSSCSTLKLLELSRSFPYQHPAANGHAIGAVNVPLDQLTAAVKGGQLAADAQIALICQSGRRSAQAAVKLTKVHGFSNVVNVQGGGALSSSGDQLEVRYAGSSASDEIAAGI
jgi:rhodanese-related sulfurtransferase